ncbi:MAG: hypothetical protein IH588_03525 [Anaerolineales bacterium]|nr:hypothetical protein [Anaerolineales bacterium]
MNHRLVGLLSLCLLVTLLLMGCLPEDPLLISITGLKEFAVPAVVSQSRGDVLAYLTTSARLAAAPPDADWQLEHGQQREGEFHFRSGDWHMTIWLPSSVEGNQHIAILNSSAHAYWCGYVKPNGQVVDTALLP